MWRTDRARSLPAQIARTTFIITGFLVAAVLSGCSLVLSTTSVVVKLPGLPEIWAQRWGPAGYLLTWQAFPTVFGALEVGPEEDLVVLDLPRATVVALLAWPVWEGGGPALLPAERMRPAGGIWSGGISGAQPGGAGGEPPPGDTAAQILLSFSSGPCALVLAEASRRGAEVQVFNHPRLHDEIRTRIPDDPWRLDVARVIRALCEHSMRVNYVRETDTVDVELDIPAGEWLSASPFAPILTGGAQRLLAVRGVTPFYDATGRRLVVMVDDEGRGWCAISPPG